MDNEQFVFWVKQNAARVRMYKLGCDGEYGKCDCIGLIIGAWRMAGNKWPWTHGSNYTARYLTDNLGKDQPLHVGDMVFKGRQPDNSGYKLPDRYKNSGDLTDYYHVGVVVSTDPLCIMHCTSGSGCTEWNDQSKKWVNSPDGGIKRDSTRGSWRYSGQFSRLQEGEGKMPDIMYVTSPNGKDVNMRVTASTSSGIVARVPAGAQVNVIGLASNGWANISYGKHKGWMMTQFLTDVENKPIDKPDKEEQENLQPTIDALEEHLKAIKTHYDAAMEILDGLKEREG